jgi:hypothetical protein
MQVYMGDAAPVFLGNSVAHVNLAISEIDVAGNSGRNSVVAQYSSPLVIDLLQYQDGAGGAIGSTPVNEQSYQSVRFVIDVSRSSVVYAGGTSAPLSFGDNGDNSSDRAGRATSTQTIDSGHVAITVREPFTIGTSASELLNVDFNLLESLVPASAGIHGQAVAMDTHGGLGMSVQPTLFLAASANEGGITGTVLNRTGNPVVNAVVVAVGRGDQIGNTVATDARGNFNLHTLAAGAYRLDIYNRYTTAAGVNLSSTGSSSERDHLRGPTITVNPGQTADAGIITD